MTPQQQKFMELSLETSKNTLTALKLANEQGAIADTIWLSKYETLFDYLESQIDAMQRILAQPEQEPEQHQDWCASLTKMLTSMPPKRAPCNCKPKPGQEPVAKVKRNSSGQIYIEWRDGEGAIAHLIGSEFYTAPPQRKPLTVEEIAKLDCYDHLKFARAIEAAHGIKGEA